MKIKFFRHFFLIVSLFFNSLVVFGSEISYNFHWLSIPVAKLSINYEKSLAFDENIEFSLSTEGPLKLYRNYRSNGFIRNINQDSWDYYLTGIDRGEPEEKYINYSNIDAPKIYKFIDDSGVSAIRVNSDLDRGAIDPFSILLEAIRQFDSDKLCYGAFLIMDGKRRYKVNLRFIGEEYLGPEKSWSYQGETNHCRLSIIDNEINDKRERKKKWPFNGGNKIVDIWFTKGINIQAVKFAFNAPIGKVIGRINRNKVE